MINNSALHAEQRTNEDSTKDSSGIPNTKSSSSVSGDFGGSRLQLVNWRSQAGTLILTAVELAGTSELDDDTSEVGETEAALVRCSVVAADWLLTGAADEGAAADDTTAEVAEDGWTGAGVCAAAADDAALVLPASGTSSCLPASGSVSRPHFSPAMLSVPP